MIEQMRMDLERLRISFEGCSWPAGVEPIMGHPDCPVLAEQYRDLGRSCYVVFVYQKTDGAYGCRHKGCFRDGDDRGPSFESPERAIHHQQSYHFG